MDMLWLEMANGWWLQYKLWLTMEDAAILDVVILK